MTESLRLYLRLISIQVRSQAHYRASFFVDLFGNVVISGMFFVTIALVMQRMGTIGGWSIGQIAFLWGMIETSFGVMDLLFSGFDPVAFSPLIQRGTFDQILLRPVDATLQILGSRFVVRRFSRIFEGIAIFIYAMIANPIDWTAGKLLYFPVAFASLVVFFGALFVAGATLTFWTIQPIEAMNIFTYGGSEMMSYPMHIYQDWMRRFFTYVLPAIFINYYPALYFLDKPDPLHLPFFAPFLSPLVAGLLMVLSLRFWRFGIDHYQSTGS